MLKAKGIALDTFTFLTRGRIKEMIVDDLIMLRYGLLNSFYIVISKT